VLMSMKSAKKNGISFMIGFQTLIAGQMEI
jgi:hypothetical protein